MVLNLLLFFFLLHSNKKKSFHFALVSFTGGTPAVKMSAEKHNPWLALDSAVYRGLLSWDFWTSSTAVWKYSKIPRPEVLLETSLSQKQRKIIWLEAEQFAQTSELILKPLCTEQPHVLDCGSNLHDHYLTEWYTDEERSRVLLMGVRKKKKWIPARVLGALLRFCNEALPHNHSLTHLQSGKTGRITLICHQLGEQGTETGVCVLQFVSL